MLVAILAGLIIREASLIQSTKHVLRNLSPSFALLLKLKGLLLARFFTEDSENSSFYGEKAVILEEKIGRGVV
ncbi:hypothetical protein [Enterococcus sp.]|uniref:hypothetical protein n=1 Tax=Enterococcus sp. TaxID=35783 RepID=UPI003C73918F